MLAAKSTETSTEENETQKIDRLAKQIANEYIIKHEEVIDKYFNNKVNDNLNLLEKRENEIIQKLRNYEPEKFEITENPKPNGLYEDKILKEIENIATKNNILESSLKNKVIEIMKKDLTKFSERIKEIESGLL